jgi:hypothetical protein
MVATPSIRTANPVSSTAGGDGERESGPGDGAGDADQAEGQTLQDKDPTVPVVGQHPGRGGDADDDQ